MDARPGVDCPPWDYKATPGYDAILAARAKDILQRLRGWNDIQQTRTATDTRGLHRSYFIGLTPPGVDYYAGHYRGEPFRCLSDYEVQIHGDPDVGHTAASIPFEMGEFAKQILAVVGELDFLWTINNAVMPREQQIYRTIELAAAVLVAFLEIHPFADGNGHMGRFILLCILSRYHVYLKRFPLHPRPNPPYVDLIPAYRRGNPRALEQFILECI